MKYAIYDGKDLLGFADTAEDVALVFTEGEGGYKVYDCEYRRFLKPEEVLLLCVAHYAPAEKVTH